MGEGVLSKIGPVRRQRQNRLRWQRQQERRRRWHRGIAAAAGLGGLLLLAAGAVGAGTAHWPALIAVVDSWLGQPPPVPLPADKPVLAHVDPAPAAPAAAAIPAPLPITVEPPPNDYEPPLPTVPDGIAAPASPGDARPQECNPPCAKRLAGPAPVGEVTEVALAALPVPVPAEPSAVAAPPPAAEDADGLPAWRRYAAAAPLSDGALIAIIIDDVGLNAARTRAVIALPAPLTLSFLPYGVHAAEMAVEARAAGHEVMLHLPMQPEDAAEDPGPKALRVDIGPAELADRLDWYLRHLPGYVGINNHMGSRFTRDEAGMTQVMRALRQRGLLFVDSVTTAQSVGLATARRFGVPALARDIFLDNARDGRQIAERLAEIETVARRNGQATAIGHPHAETVEALRRWLPGLEAKGFTLAPVSALLRRRLAS